MTAGPRGSSPRQWGLRHGSQPCSRFRATGESREPSVPSRLPVSARNRAPIGSQTAPRRSRGDAARLVCCARRVADHARPVRAARRLAHGRAAQEAAGRLGVPLLSSRLSFPRQSPGTGGQYLLMTFRALSARLLAASIDLRSAPFGRAAAILPLIILISS